MEDSIKKFFDKNVKALNELDNLISDGNDIRKIIISIELNVYLETLPDYEVVHEELTRYKMRHIIVDPYSPAGTVRIVRKDCESVKFEVPCVCGIYKDEKHP